ncbi:MAG TPA: hypothetical protein VIS10_06160 [Anaerolineales bacterium]
MVVGSAIAGLRLIPPKRASIFPRVRFLCRAPPFQRAGALAMKELAHNQATAKTLN